MDKKLINAIKILQQGGYNIQDGKIYAQEGLYTHGGKWGIPQYSTQQDSPEYQEQLRNTYAPQNNPYGLPQVSQNVPYPSFFDQYPSPEDENLQKKTEETKKTYTDEYNLINPYGDVGLEQALSFAGRGFGSGNIGQGILGAGLVGLKGTRNFLSGYGVGKSEKEAQQSYRANMRDNSQGYANSQQGGKIYAQEGLGADYWDFNEPPFQHPVLRQGYQQGGEIENVEMLTGEYAQPLPPQAFEMANVNVEEDEYIKHGDSGVVQEVPGKKHKDGGEDMALSEGSKVISDYTEIGSANAKHFLNAYGIKLSAKDTFAKALDKYSDKIGLEKLFEEEEEVLKEVEKQTKGKKDKNSQDLNYQFLSEKLQEIAEKRKPLEAIRANMFEDVFARQEAIPKKGNGELLDDDGKPMKQQGGGIQSSQEEMQEGQASNPQEVQGEMDINQIMQQVAQAIQQGADPNQVAEQLIQMGIPQDQVVGLIEQVMAQVQPQEEAMMQMGGVVQQDPMLNELAKKYGIPLDRVQQLLEGGQEAYQQGGKIYAQEGREIVYNSTTGRNEYRTNSRVKQRSKKDGAYGDPDPEIALQRLYNNFPDIVSSKFKDNIEIDELGNVKFKKNLPFNKEQEIVRDFQKQSNSRMRASADVILKNPKRFPPEQVKEAQRYLNEETFLDVAPGAEDEANSIRGFDAKLGNFTSGRYSMGVDLLTPEDLKKAQAKGIKTIKQLKESDLYGNLSKESKDRVDNMNSLIGNTDADFSINEFNIPAQTPAEKTLTEEEQKVENITRTNNVIFKGQNPFIMPPSSLQPIAKQSVEFGRIDPTKVSIEPNVQEANRQLQASLQNYGNTLSPEVAAAMQAQAVGQSQQAVNQAISQAEVANAGQQFQADQYNLGVDMKETLMNTQLAGQYQDQMMKGLANQEADWRGYFNKLNEIQSLNNLNYNKTVAYNAMNDDYFMDGNGIRFKNTNPNFQNNNQIPAKKEETKKAVKKQQGGILTKAQRKALGLK